METQENSNYLHKLLPQDKKQRCAGYQMLACYETDSDNEKHLTSLILTIWVNQWILFMFMQICKTAFSVYCETGCYSVPIPFTVHLKFLDHWISWSVSSTVTLSYYVKTFAQSSIISEDWVLNFNFWDYLKREKDLMSNPGGARRLPLSIFGFTLRWHKTARTTVQVISFLCPCSGSWSRTPCLDVVPRGTDSQCTITSVLLVVLFTWRVAFGLIKTWIFWQKTAENLSVITWAPAFITSDDYSGVSGHCKNSGRTQS